LGLRAEVKWTEAGKLSSAAAAALCDKKRCQTNIAAAVG
jgi:hypothetical protein